MTDAEFEEQRSRIDKLAKRWLPLLGLDRWNIKHEYQREDAIPLGGISLSENAVCTMKNACDWRYEYSTITVDMRQIDYLPDDELETKYVHELMHCFLSEVRQPYENQADWLDHEEHAAQSLAKAMVRLIGTAYNAGLKDGADTD